MDTQIVEEGQPVPGVALVPTPSGPPVRSQPVITPEGAIDLSRKVRDLLRSALVKGVDFGTVANLPKPMLFNAGAEKLLKFFGLVYRFEILDVERNPEGQRVGVTYRAVISTVTDNLSRVDIAAADAYAGRDEPKLSKAPWNTIIKMAEKRALVGATLSATATSGLFQEGN